MIGPHALIIAAALATGVPAEGPGPSIRWEVASSGVTSSVSLVGLSPEALAPLRQPTWTDDRWPKLFSIDVSTPGPRPADRPSMLGTYRLEGETLRFTPRFPMDRGRTYSATYRPSQVPGGVGPEFTMRHLVPRPPRASTLVTRVAPSGDKLPENLLKFYLHFSSPMGRGEVYDRVRLLRDDGKAVDFPFLRLGEELWDPTGTRLTLLIDPGRIKRGLKPREQFGPVLEAGRTYTLVIDPSWARRRRGRPAGGRIPQDVPGRPRGRNPARPEDLGDPPANRHDPRSPDSDLPRAPRLGPPGECADGGRRPR